MPMLVSRKLQSHWGKCLLDTPSKWRKKVTFLHMYFHWKNIRRQRVPPSLSQMTILQEQVTSVLTRHTTTNFYWFWKHLRRLLLKMSFCGTHIHRIMLSKYQLSLSSRCPFKNTVYVIKSLSHQNSMWVHSLPPGAAFDDMFVCSDEFSNKYLPIKYRANQSNKD